jgi:hypothetical protein
MARSGVLADQAIKERYPEFFPIDVGGQEFLHGINLDKHIFKGIKPSRTNRSKNVSRFPINDLANFASISAPARKQKAQFDAIMNYRKSIGSTNFSENLQTAFAGRLQADYTPILPRPAEYGAGGVQVAPTLSLGRFNRKEGQDIYSNVVPGSRSYISARMRATLANLASRDELLNLNETFAPGGFNPRSGQLTDDYILNKLNRNYRDNPEELNMIERAYHASGRQHILPIEMTPENRFENLEEENL